MPVPSVAVDAAELAQRDLDKPYLLGQNVARSYNALPQWRTSGSWSAGTDLTDPSFPTRRLIDGSHAFASRMQLASATAVNELFLLFDLAAAASREVDTIIVALDVRSCGTAVRIRAEIADDAAFTVNLRTLADAGDWSGTGAGDNRGNWKLIMHALSNGGGSPNQRLNTLRYLRLRFDRNAGGVPPFLDAPLVYEVTMGRRRQLAHFPVMPHDDQRRYSEVADYVAYSGWDQRVVRHRGAQPFDLQIPMADGGSVAGVDEVTNLRAAYADAEDGTRTLYLVDQPLGGGTLANAGLANTTLNPPRGLHVRMVAPELGLPKIGPVARDMEPIRMRELPPFRTLEVRS